MEYAKLFVLALAHSTTLCASSKNNTHPFLRNVTTIDGTRVTDNSLRHSRAFFSPASARSGISAIVTYTSYERVADSDRRCRRRYQRDARAVGAFDPIERAGPVRAVFRESIHKTEIPLT